jgi:NMD protein affecting ribosome stability and mRNA decay
VKQSTKSKILNVKPMISEIKLKVGIKKKIPVSFDFNGHEHLAYPDVEISECSLCKHQKTQYFEGVFQLRNPNLEVERFVNNKVEKTEKFRMWINKELKVKNGIDYYYVNKEFFTKLAYNAQARFGGEVKISNKLFSRDRLTSKNIYRTNILLRIPEFKIGEVVLVDNKLIKISKIGKSLSGIKLLTNKSTSVEYRRKDVFIMETFTTTISKAYPKLEIIDPKTYQSVEALNQRKIRVGEKVEVVFHEGWWVI